MLRIFKPNVETRYIDNFIARLRKYFEDDISEPKHIISVRSAGYMFQIEKNNLSNVVTINIF